MKISAEKLQGAISENKKELSRMINLLNEKRHILEVYGYEEEGETVEKYEKLIDVIKGILKRCEEAELLNCGNYNF